MVSKRTTEYLIPIILLVFSSGLILANLGNIYLWEDEAHTALLAKTVLSHGVPLAYDGKNYFSQLWGRDYGKSFIWKWHPWFPFYLLAGFMPVFGTSNFAVRLPFALMGIGTVLLTYFFAASLWRNRRAGVLSATVLLASVPFLLLVRQCRYYSPDIFFSLLGLYGYYGMLEQRKRSGLIFALSAILLFHTQFVQCAALLAAVVTHSLLFRRKALKSVLILSGIVTLVCMPWVIWFSSLGREVSAYGSLVSRMSVVGSYLIPQTFKHIFPPLILVLPIVLFAVGRLRHKPKSMGRQEQHNLALLLLFAFFTIATLSLSAPNTFFRYLAPLIPVACIIMGLIIESGMKVHPAVGVIIIGLLAWWWRMPSYLYEITHDYNGPIEGVVTYLNAHAGPDDVVAVTHEDLPIKWYTNLRVIGPVSGEDFKPALNADWLVLRQQVTDPDYPFIGFLMKSIPWGKYEQIPLPYPDIVFENREDPEEHHFRTVENPDSPVVIYRRTRR